MKSSLQEIISLSRWSRMKYWYIWYSIVYIRGNYERDKVEKSTFPNIKRRSDGKDSITDSME